MGSLASILAGIDTRLATISGLYHSDEIPDSIVQLPFAFVAPGKVGMFADYVGEYSTFDGGMAWNLIVRLYVSKWDFPRATDILTPYLANTGTKSIKAAIEGDPHLGGVASDATVLGASGFGPYNIGGVDYLGCDFSVRVLSDS